MWNAGVFHHVEGFPILLEMVDSRAILAAYASHFTKAATDYPDGPSRR